jgi:DNA-binding NtrC family response regulator
MQARGTTTVAKNKRPSILVVEDDSGLRQLLLDELSDAGHDAKGAASVSEGRSRLVELEPQLVISDLRLPDGRGTELLPVAKGLPSPPAFIVITAFGTVDQAVEAVKQGADEFITKPLDLDHLQLSVARVLEMQELQREVLFYRKLLSNNDFHGMVGRSKPMRHLFTQIEQVAQAGGPVLVSGESGVGKELVARAIHEQSARASGPFVAMNCGAIPASLMESELFGHVAGAFTGASKAREGLFAAADGGTLLLDEIGEMPLDMQATLLRILQDGRVRPVGSTKEVALDVRIVAATNRDLLEEVREGGFREDLYYRLETFALEVPPLRQRGADIDLLVARFIGHFSARLQRNIKGITPEALEHLRGYPFPGNVRELANAIERAVTFCQEERVGLEHLPARIVNAPSVTRVEMANAQQWQPPLARGELLPLEDIERSYVHFVLSQVNNNKLRAAEILGIGRRTLYRWLDTTGN